MDIDIDPEKREGLLRQAALGGEEVIEGLTLRPMTNGTKSLWCELAALSDGNRRDAGFNIYSMVFLQSQPQSKIRASFSDPSKLLPELYDFMENRPLGDYTKFRQWYDRQIEMIVASTIKSDAVLEAAGESPKV